MKSPDVTEATGRVAVIRAKTGLAKLHPDRLRG